MKILNFGSCNIDYVYSMDHIVVPGETLPSRSLELFPGGKGLNQSIALARAGVKVYHAGAIGKDGEMLARTLAENGVDLAFLDDTAERTGHAIIQLSAAGENSILLYPGANATLSEAYIDRVLSHFEAGDVLLLQNETNLVPYIIEKAAERGMRTLFNPAPFTPALAALDYGQVAWLVLNEIEAAGLGGMSTPRENLEKLRRAYPDTSIVLTLGSKGCIYADATETFSHPAYVVDVVDTTAAGDTFIGYFLAGVVQGMGAREAVSGATAAAALAVSKKGAATSIPHAAEIEAALKTLQTAKPRLTREQQLVEQINAFIASDPIAADLEGLSVHLGYSKTYTGELVRRMMGVSFSGLLQRRRCELAAAMLCETDLTVEEIICRVGYRNESFFRSIFKKQYGMSLYRYKKTGGGKYE